MDKIQIDLVSDVVCPWCIIGYKRLQIALDQLKDQLSADVHWHPFELNPAMTPEGQNLFEHINEKYGSDREASLSSRQTLSELAHEVGFEMNFSEDMRIYNTRKAHQLLLWAESEGKQHDLQMALFDAYFTQGQDISNNIVLLSIARAFGLDPDIAKQVLSDEGWADSVASTEQQWIEAGINAVPTIIINRKHIISGAQQVEVLKETLLQASKLPTS